MPSIARFFLYCANSSVVKVMESSEWKNISKSKNLRLSRLPKTALELAVEVGHPTVSDTRIHCLKYVTNIKNETYFRVLNLNKQERILKATLCL